MLIELVHILAAQKAEMAVEENLRMEVEVAKMNVGHCTTEMFAA